MDETRRKGESLGGEQPSEKDVRRWLEHHPEFDADHVVQLLQAHQAECWRQGICVPAETYLQLHPALLASPECALDLIYGEYLLREELGFAPTPEEFFFRFPEYENDIRGQFALTSVLASDGVVSRNAAAPPSDCDAQAPMSSGQRFGDYDLLELIGQGGMGVVYKARQRGLNRLVAVKMIRTREFSTREEIQRLQTEAENAASLNHPHIVPVYEVSQHDGQHFFSMKLLEAGTLSDRLPGYLEAPRQAAALVKEVALAVHYAHQHGILHRDLKPSNILFDSDGHGYVADFGLARRIDRSTGQTVSNAIVGTPSFLAPEQAAGNQRGVTTAADVYGLGAILYTLLTARPPFQHDSILETLQQVRTEEPLPPSRLRRETPRDLEIICLKCLRKNIAERYASAQALADDLGRYLTGDAIQARDVSRGERVLRWIRRNPVLAGAGGLIAVVMITAFVIVLSFWRNSDAHRVVAEQEVYFGCIALAEREWEANRLGRVRQVLDSCPETYRRWEWRHLDGRLRGESIRLPESEGATCAAFSWDGKSVFAGFSSPASAVVIWDVGRQAIVTQIACPGPPSGMASSPDGRWLAVSSGKEVFVFDLILGKLRHQFMGDEKWVSCLAISPDSRSLAVGGREKLVRIRNLATGRQTGQALAHESWVAAMVWSPDSDKLATVAYEFHKSKCIQVWSAPDGCKIGTIEDFDLPVLTMAFSPDGRHLAAGAQPTDPRLGENCDVRVFEATTLKRVNTLPCGKGAIAGIRFSSDSKRLAAACEDDTVHVWHLDSRKTALMQRGLPIINSFRQFHPDLQRMVTSSHDEGVRIWDITTVGNSCVLELIEPRRSVVALAVSPDGSRLTVADGGHNVSAWNPQTRQRAWLQEQAHAAYIHAVAFSPDGTTVASAARDGRVRFWAAVDGSSAGSELIHPDQVWCLAYAPDGRHLATGCMDGKIRLWNLVTRDIEGVFCGHTGVVRTMCFCSGGGLLISGGDDGQLLWWDTRTGKYQASSHSSSIVSMALSFDGRALAVGTRDANQHFIAQYDVRKRTLVRELRGHTGEITSLAFSPDGKRLVSGAKNHFLIVWDPASGRDVLTLHGHSADVNAVVWNPDGRALYSGSWDCTVRIWDAKPAGDK